MTTPLMQKWIATVDFDELARRWGADAGRCLAAQRRERGETEPPPGVQKAIAEATDGILASALRVLYEGKP